MTPIPDIETLGLCRCHTSVQVLDPLRLCPSDGINRQTWNIEVCNLFRNASAVLLDQRVQELKGIAGLVHLFKSVNDHFSRDIGLEQIREG